MTCDIDIRTVLHLRRLAGEDDNHRDNGKTKCVFERVTDAAKWVEKMKLSHDMVCTTSRRPRERMG